MSQIADRLAELGLTLPAVAAPVAAYVPAMISGNLVFTSGQLPFVDGVAPGHRQGGRGRRSRVGDGREGLRRARAS